MKRLADIYKNVLMLTQLGFSFVTPLLLCLALCWFLNSYLGLGSWIYIPGFFFGLGGSGMTAYKFYLVIERKQEKESKKEKKKIYFNHH